MPILLSGSSGITYPNNTVGTTGNGPAFSAFLNSQQTPGANTWTKVVFNGEEFDTNSNYDTANSRFTPTVAGYYYFVMQVGGGPTASNLTRFYKNGSVFKESMLNNAASAIFYGTIPLSALIYMNGTTDYIEAYFFTASSYAIDTASRLSFFQGYLVRGA